MRVLFLVLCFLSFNADAFFLGNAFMQVASVRPPLGGVDITAHTKRPRIKREILVCSTNNGLDCIDENGNELPLSDFAKSKGFKTVYQIYENDTTAHYLVMKVSK